MQKTGGGTGATAPSNLVYSVTAINAAVEFPMNPDAPSVTGSVTSYSVTPALPPGLSLNASTGVISGTPKAVAAQANYTVTASNAGGQTTTVLQIAVSLAAPDKLVYPQTSINASIGIGIQPDVPSVEGVVSAYSVSPALPAGLSIDSKTGIISGTPTAPAAQASYVITASNSVGDTTASVQIAVSLAPPSNLLYPAAMIDATTGTAISPDVPSVTGQVSGYSVSPPLPVGLTFDTSTGTIAGTPTAASAKVNYTVTASNASGSTTATLQITVTQSAPSNLVYPVMTINARVGTAITADTPTVTGLVSGYSISPALPAGLSLDASNGTISGTPTAASAQAVYTVKAQNGTGSTTAQVTITVSSGPVVLYQGGHQTQITSLHSNSDRLLSADDSGHWILWNYSSGDIIAQGDGSRLGDLEGQIFAVNSNTAAGFQLRSTQDGSLLASTATVSSFSLPADGSFACTATSSQLTIWSASGASEVERNGDYSKAAIFAAAGKVFVAKGPAGQNVIETIDVVSGASTLSPAFSGTFQFWFGDGSNFVTQLSNVYWVYSNAAVQQMMSTTPSGIDAWGGGAGNWLWGLTSTHNLEVFTFGGTTPVQTFALPFDSTLVQQGATVEAFDYGYPDLTVVDFSETTPTITKLNLPATEAWVTAYTKNASGEWAVGNLYGVLMDGTNSSSPVYFDYGQVLGLAAGGNAAALATASGRILLYDVTTGQQTGTINFLASQMEMSSDGSVLAAGADAQVQQYAPDRTLNIYSLPSQSLIQSFPYTLQDNGMPFLIGFSLSGSGTTLGQLTETAGGTFGFERQVTGITGTPLIWSDSVEAPMFLSPDGTLIAALTFGDAKTWIYKNGVPIVEVDGSAEGWIDNNHLLVATFASFPWGLAYSGSTIYDAGGAVVKTFSAGVLPQFGPSDYGYTPNPQFPSTNSVYDMYTDAIYSLTDGSVIWQGPGVRSAAISGTNLVYYGGSYGDWKVQVVQVP